MLLESAAMRGQHISGSEFFAHRQSCVFGSGVVVDVALLLVIALYHILLVLRVGVHLGLVLLVVHDLMVVWNLVGDLVLGVVLVCLVYLCLAVEFLPLHDRFLVATEGGKGLSWYLTI